MQPYLITNCNGYAMDPDGSRFQAMAVQAGYIRALGSAQDLAPLVCQGWQVMDMGGRTVLPGFIDCHQHLGLTGQTLLGVDLSRTTSLDQVFQLLADRRDTSPVGQWIQAFTLMDLNLDQGRMPLMHELDRISQDHPMVVVHACWHICSLNSRAMQLLSPPPGLPGMDMDSGSPTGVIRDPGVMSHIFPKLSAMRDQSSKLQGFKAAADLALRQGVTAINCLEGGEYGPDESLLLHTHRNDIPQHLVLWNQSMDLGETLSLGLPRIGGCICADGAIDCYTAALFEDYSNQPGNRGTLNFSQEQMDGFVREAHEHGLQIAVHCESEASIEQVLLAMEKAQKTHPRENHRHRIEHFEVPAPGQVERMARLGAVASMQPAFIPYLVDMHEYRTILGPERLNMLHPYRSLLEAGVTVAGGSDCPVTPCSPLMGIMGAVTHPLEHERVTVEQAVNMFTASAAYASFLELERGCLTPGRLADFVVLDQDPFAVSPESLGSITVLATGLHGDIHEFADPVPGMSPAIEPII